MARNLRDGGEKGDMRKLIKYGLPYFTLVFMVICVFIAQRLSVYRQIMQESLELSRTINSRIGIDTTSSIDSLKNLVIELQLENRSYTSNVEIFSNYIILFVTILFGIFFAVGYGLFDNKVDQIKSENIESLKKINEAYAKHENELLELRKYLVRGDGNISVLLADFCNKNGYFGEELFFKINAANSFRQCLQFKDGHKLVEPEVIETNLQDIYKLLNQEN